MPCVALSDLFDAYNIDLVGKFRPGVVLGPPASGKCFLINSYYSSNALESILGFVNLRPVKACSEHVIHGEGLKMVKEGNITDRVVDFLRAVFPWVKALMDTKPISKVLDELRRRGFSDVEVETVKRHFTGVDRIPNRLISHLINLRSEYGSVMLYGIPWDVDEKYKLNNKVSEAVAMIKRHFERGIKWLGVKYIPPGLVVEVVEKIGSEGLDKAEEYVREQANAYYRVVKLLVGEEDVEFEGFLAMGVTNFINQFTTNAIKHAIGIVLSGIASLTISAVALAMALSLIYQLTKKPGVSAINEIIELREYWPKLHESLRRLIASKVALQLDTTPEEAEEALNQLTRMEMDRLKQLISDIQNKLEELERRVGELENRVDLLEGEVKGLRIYKLYDVADGRLYPNVRLVGDDLGVVSTVYGEFEVSIVRSGRFNDYLNQTVNGLRNGFVVLIGPRGVGKSTLAIYTIWKLLKEGGYYGIIRIDELIDDNAKLSLENFLRTYARDFAEILGRLIILYDPLTTEAYTAPGVNIEAKPIITKTIEQLTKLVSILNELKMPLIIVVSSDLYDVLVNEVKESLSKYVIDINLRDEELLGGIIREYSGCNLSDDELRRLVSEVLRFNEGYTLIARMVGENLRRSHCMVEDIRGMLEKSQGDSRAFIINWINEYLGIISKETNEPNVPRIKALAEALMIREPFKAGLRPGNYIMTPYLMDRLIYWSSGGQVVLSDELSNWLVIKHEDLLEDAVTMIVMAIRGEGVEGTDYLSDALKPWEDYGELGSKVYTINEAINYLVNNYGNKLRAELGRRLSDECWDALALVIGTVWSGHRLGTILERAKSEINDLMPMVKSAMELLGNVNKCNATRLLVIHGEVPPLINELLLKDAGNPILDALVEGRSGRIKEGLSLYMNIINNSDQNTSNFLVINIYVFGLVALTAYAVLRGIKEYVDNNELKVKALEATNWSIYSVGSADAAIRIISMLNTSNLGNASPDLWASILSGVTGSVLIDYDDKRRSLIPLIDDLFVKRNAFKDWGKANLIEARASTLSVRRTVEEKYRVLNELLNAIDEIGSEALRTLEKVYIYWRFTGTVTVHDASLKSEVEKLINIISNANQANWLRDQQLVEYLRHYDTTKDALLNLIKSTMAMLYDIMYNISMDLGDIENAMKYNEKAKEIRKELEQWYNYIIDRRATIRIKILKANNIEEIVKACGEFGDVYRESVEKLMPTADELVTRADSLSKYLACLGIVGDEPRIKELMSSDGWLLNYITPRSNVALRLFLSWLGMGFNKPSADEVVNAIKEHLQTDLVPALRRALGVEVNCSDECSRCCNSRLCGLACSAVEGDRNALSELVGMLGELVKNIPMDIRGGFSPELVSRLVNHRPGAVIQAIAPLRLSTAFVLALNALVNGDYDAVRAISEYVEYAFNAPIPQKLFREFREAVEGGDKYGIALAAIKLFFYYY